MINGLGLERVKNFHIHFSKIEYSAKGEVKHLTFNDQHYGPSFKFLAPALKKLNLKPVCICESSGTQDKDALEMKNIYESA
jgi:deoxyribonuclease-4